jgi:pantetheine-phosphate adenylyltransferase
MSYVVIGGTFDNLHLGHKALIQKAFETGDRVLVCVTSDKMIRDKPLSKKIENYKTRKGNVVGYIWENGWQSKAEVVKIEDPFTQGLRPKLTHIVVSEETMANAEKINKMRMKKGTFPLKIIKTGWVLSEDGKPISDIRIRKGEIDGNGKLLKKQENYSTTPHKQLTTT